MGGKIPRSPLWIRRTGIEWLFRLAMGLRRLFQRYVIGNPLFLIRAVRLPVLKSPLSFRTDGRLALDSPDSPQFIRYESEQVV